MAHHRRWREDDSSRNSLLPQNIHHSSTTQQSKMSNYFQYGLFSFGVLLCLKFLLFTEPLSLEEMGPFRNETMIQFDTEHGPFIIELYHQEAPRTVAHILQLVDQGFYSGGDTGFYRYEPNFLIQGGGFIHNKMTRNVQLPIEYSVPSDERSVVLARQKEASSGYSEFSIMLGNNAIINQPSDLDKNPGYTTFGRIYEGWNIIQRITGKMNEGFLKKEDAKDSILFKSAKKVQRILPIGDAALKTAFYDVKNHIETEYSVVMFSKTTCPYCRKAKQILMDELKAEVHVVEIDLLPNGPMYQDSLDAMTGRRTVPNVFINQRSIGGGDDTNALYKSGKLKSLLEEAGALSKTFILDTIKTNPVAMFSKSYCPFCKKVKEILDSLKVKYVAIELDLRPDGAAIQYNLHKLTGRKTVPNVFIGGKTIGGGDETGRLHKSGELTLLLQSAGAL